MQGPKTTKWVQSSCATYANHHKNEVRDYFKKQKILHGPKTIFFFLQGPKLKRGIFAGTSAIFKPLFYYHPPTAAQYDFGISPKCILGFLKRGIIRLGGHLNSKVFLCAIHSIHHLTPKAHWSLISNCMILVHNFKNCDQ